MTGSDGGAAAGGPGTVTTPAEATALPPGPPSRRRRIQRAAARQLPVVAIMTVAAVVATWPLTRFIGSRVPQNLGDPLENTWIFTWPAAALADDPTALFHGNIYHPEGWTLAFAENLLGQSLPVAPLWWLTGNPVLVTNVGLLLVLIVSGWTMSALVEGIGGRRLPAVVAGVAYIAVPYRIDAIGHPHVIGSHLFPLVVLLLFRVRERATGWRIAGLALALAAQFWSSMTVGVYAFLVTAGFVLWTLVRERRRPARVIGPFVVAAAAGALLVVPILVPYLKVRSAHPFEHADVEILAFSATPTSYLEPSEGGPLVDEPNGELRERFGQGRRAAERQLFPGYWAAVAGPASAAAVVGGLALAARRRRRLPPWVEPAGVLLLIALAGAVLSFGPRWHGDAAGQRLPFALLDAAVPGSLMRVPARFAVVVHLGLVAAAGIVLSSVGRRWRRALLAASAVVLAVQIVPPAFAMIVPPARSGALDAVRDRPGVVMHLPTVEFRNGGIAGETVPREAAHMYLSTAHLRPIVNGYGALLPASFFEIIWGVQEFPTDAAMALLERRGVRTVVVETSMVVGTPWADVVARLDAWPGARRVSTSANIVVFALHGT